MVWRRLGVAEAVHAAAPPAVLAFFALATNLGDLWFLVVLAGVPYAANRYAKRCGLERREALFVVGLVVVYVGLVGFLKAVFDLPRPPGAATPPPLDGLPRVLVTVIGPSTTAEGAGFPSGHALGSTLVWGGTALAVDEGSPRWRISASASVVLLVAASRVVLGLHYLVDVLAGIGVGVAVLAVLYPVAGRGSQPAVVLVFGVLVSIGGVLVGAGDRWLVLGVALGAAAAWSELADLIDRQPASATGERWGLLALLVGSVVGLVVYATQPSTWLSLVGGAVSGALVVAAPVVGERLSRSSA